MARIVTHRPRPRPIVGQTDAPTPDFNLKRIGTGIQDDPPAMRPWTPASLADQRERTGAPNNDSRIRRDGVPQFLRQNWQRAGAPVNNWTAAGPARPTLWTERGQTLTPRSGVSVSRWLRNPGDPTGQTGLHTQVITDASGKPADPRTSQGRYVDNNVPQMRARRQNRLSPAVYTGQSFSQTTKVQGAR